GLAAHREQQVVEVGAGGARGRGAALLLLGATLEIGEHAFYDGINQWHSCSFLAGARGAKAREYCPVANRLASLRCPERICVRVCRTTGIHVCFLPRGRDC